MNRSLGKSQNWQKGFAEKGFWKSFGHNWAKVLASNSILLGANILAFAISLCLVLFVFPMIFSFFTPDGLRTFILENKMAAEADVTPEAVDSIFYLMAMLASMFVSGMMLIVNGPFYSALSYYYKGLLTGDASFKSDFKRGLKDNWKKSLGAMFLSILVTAILFFDIGYFQLADMGMMSAFANGFFLCLLVFWAAMQIFVYPLIATVELSFKEVYRNAAIMTVKNFPACMGVVLFESVIFGVIPFVLMFAFGQTGYAITMILYLIFSFSFILFLSVYITWKAVQKIVQNDN